VAKGIRLCAVDDLAPGEKRRIVVGSRAIALCRSASGEYFAIGDNCPHQGASLCAGALGGTTLPSTPGQYAWGREGEVLKCPWHAWEFDVRSGRSLFGDEKMRIASYELRIEDGDVIFAGRRGRKAAATPAA
jgi:3-phenylpropionate/trans-cinnamate dioxygenase ferredoxin subunit